MNQQLSFIPDHFIPALGVSLAGGLSLIVVVVAGLLMAWLYRKYLVLGREGCFLLAAGTVIAATAAAVYVGNHFREFAARGDYRTTFIIARNATDGMVFYTGILVLTGIPLAAKFYQAWIGGVATERERQPGVAGVRAWLSPIGLLLALGVSISAANGFDYSFLAVFILIIGALVAYPVFNSMQKPASASPPAEPVDTLAGEREKVLSMLEAGKITAEESAELLNALGSTVKPPQTGQVAISTQQRLSFIGAGLVLIGFFLPWFRINPAEVLNRMTGQFSNFMNEVAPQMPAGMPGGADFSFNGLTLHITGGDVQHGLGWFILLASATVALLPFFASRLDVQSRRTVSVVTLGVGSVLLLYLFTQGLRFLDAGILLAAAGYCAQWIAIARHADWKGFIHQAARQNAGA